MSEPHMLTPEEVGAVPAGEGWECLSVLGEMQTTWCAHQLLALVRDDWAYFDVACEVAACLLCGQVMVRWEAQSDDAPSS